MLFTFMPRGDDEPWHRQTPDLEKYYQLKEEMGERVFPVYEPPRRESEDRDVHPYIRYGVKVGIPSAMACVFAWWMLLHLNSKLDAQKQWQDDHASGQSLLMLKLGSIGQSMDRMVALATVDCMKAAKGAAEREECGRAGR